MMHLKYFTFMLSAVLCMAAVPVPDGWQPPAQKESKQGFRKEGPRHFMKISEDFNGDGILDEAMVLVNKTGRGSALFAFVSQKQGYKTCILDNLEETWWLDAVGVRVAARGDTIRPAAGCTSTAIPESLTGSP